MKLYGDVSQKDIDLAAELNEMQKFLDTDLRLTKENRAKGYVCCAHDWFQLNCEEQAFNLLDKAENVCPGYFKETMLRQTKEDEEYARLVSNLSVELTYLLINNLKDGFNR